MSFNFKLHSLLLACRALYCKTLHFPGSLNPLSSGLAWSVRGRGGRQQSRVNEEARVLHFSHPVHLIDPTWNPRPSSLGHGWLWREWFKLSFKFQTLGSIHSFLMPLSTQGGSSFWLSWISELSHHPLLGLFSLLFPAPPISWINVKALEKFLFSCRDPDCICMSIP